MKCGKRNLIENNAAGIINVLPYLRCEVIADTAGWLRK